MELTKTNRGFKLGKFIDAKNVECSIQDSSLATKAAIWFGVQEANPQKMGKNGWEKAHPLEVVDENEILFTTRMHLGKSQVRTIISIFKKFLNDKKFNEKSFQDIYQKVCSICKQENYLVIGCDNADPKICQNGWRTVEFPEETVFTTHMFLEKEQVEDILPLLENFLKEETIYNEKVTQEN